MGLEVIPVAVNRYAPQGSELITMYSSDLDTGPLTLTQIIMQICLRSAACYEAQSVIKMNTMTANSEILTNASELLEDIVNNEADWETAKSFMVDVLGIDEDELPDDLSTYDNRMTAAELLQDKINGLAQSQQEDMIDLQSLVSRRDTSMSTSSSVIKSTGQSMYKDIQNFSNN